MMADESGAQVLPDQTADPRDYRDHSQGLYRHVKRPQWGCAVLAWSRKTKRGYQFDDGKVRVFREGFYSLLREVDEDEVSEGIVEELRRRVARRRREGATRREPLNLKPAMPWADQLRIFELMYPGGFRGEAWTREHRGTDAKRRLKRHRDPLLEDARELMTKQRLTAALSGAGVESLLDDYAAVLRRTSLCGKKYATRVGELRGDAAQAYAEALRETLFGSGSVASRFRHWLAVHESWFARPPSWKDATLPLAIAFPNDFICVHKRSFLLQAGELAPGRGYTRSASAQGYVAMRRLGREVVEKLVEAGHEPRDLMDVYDFIVTTLKPSSAKVLNG